MNGVHRAMLSFSLVLLWAFPGWAQMKAAPAESPQATTSSQADAPLDEAMVKTAADYLVKHYQTPEDYVVSKFKDHDIVFLGETTHGLKQNMLFLQKLIPLLYKAGIYNLGFEMLEQDDQAEADRLINAPTYDNNKALELEFHWDPGVGWTMQEYADVFRAAWKVNHNLPKGAPRFRIVGIDMKPDWALIKPGDAYTTRAARWNAWMGSNQISRNVWMVQVVRYEFINKHLKALMYDGSGHVTLDVTKDQREETGLRFSSAHELWRKYGNRITTIEIHSTTAQDRVTAPVIAVLPEKYKLIGYDLKGTPVGELPLPQKVADVIVSDKKQFTVADYVTDGAVQISLNAELATSVPSFITEARVETVKREGWLPNIPEITADSILQHHNQMMQNVH